jgi:hypothetical protein
VADNAAMANFFSLLQKNVLNRRRWTTLVSPHRRRDDRSSVLRRLRPPHVDRHAGRGGWRRDGMILSGLSGSVGAGSCATPW